MKKRRMCQLGLLALSLAVCGAAAAAGDPVAGKAKSTTCLGCHGIKGYTNVYPTFQVPKLGGQHAAYIVSALKEYKSGARKHPTMQAQASALSEQDMADIAAYFSGQKKQ